ncbi:MAG: hypothetical protein IJW40_10030 [Clostridia bacterium]|nr:hypothetical protein [Clostridia bacterium]
MRSAFSLAFIIMIFGVPAIFESSLPRVYLACIGVIETIYIVGVVFLSRTLNLKRRILINGYESILLSVLFMLLSGIYWEINQGLYYWYHMATLPFVMAGISILLMDWNVKKGRYSKIQKNLNFTLITVGAMIGVAFGNVVTLLVPGNVKLDQVYVFAAVFMEILSCIFALGSSSFLKLHYIKKMKNIR